MLPVNFLTFVFKVFYFFYLTFIIIPIAVTYAILIMMAAFCEWIVEISIVPKKKY
jgi:hypothetical protein